MLHHPAANNIKNTMQQTLNTGGVVAQQ